ncbi:hypothetical protein [uncultured Parasphingorhabdus sp.]|uniref:hypothetical protein n=1 Tax=uncultured Parasphingorhabdus sp. TaxID=2709694 RepID=UPI0030D9467F|tara:strand:- start:5165 stop:5512 length:348 start_codon:yes stop_codon:yes gene_type:complete
MISAIALNLLLLQAITLDEGPEPNAAGIACGITRTVTEVYQDEVADKTTAIAFVKSENGGAPIPVPGAAFRLMPGGAIPGFVTGIGTHTREILGGLGLDDKSLETVLEESGTRSA